MKQIFLSLMALIVLSSFASAATMTGLSLDLAPGQTKTGDITLSSVETISAVQIMLDGDLTGSAGTITNGDVTFTPNTFTSISNETKTITVSVLARSGVADGTYTGTIKSTFSIENGSNDQTTSQLTVVVTTPPVTGASVVMNDQTLGTEDTKRDRELTHTFDITNNGGEVLTGINLTSDIDTSYDVTYSGIPATLAVGAKATISMKYTIPLSKDATLQEVGLLTLRTNELTKTSKLFVEAENYLSIEELTVTVIHRDGDEWDDTLDDGDDVREEIKPGDTIRIEIEVENKNSDDIDFNDVEVRIENDDELDVDEDDEQDINEDRSEVFEFEFDVDNNADEGSQDLIITVKGTDDEDADHEIEWVITFDIEKPSRELLINRVDISPSIVSCQDTLRVEVEIENTGSRDLDEAMVELEIEGLGIRDFERDIEIDEGDDEDVTFNVNIADARAGTYFVDITSYYDRSDNDDSDVESEEFTIQNCGSNDNTPRDDVDTDNDSDDTDSVVDVNPGSGSVNVNGGSSTPTGNVIQSVGKPSFFESTGYLVLLTGLVLVLIIVIAVLLLTKKN